MSRRSRWAQVQGRRRTSRDALVAIALLVLMVVAIKGKEPAAGQRGADALAYILAIPLALPFAVHRRLPMTSLAVTVAAFTAYAVLDYAAYPGVSVFAILFGSPRTPIAGGR